MERDTTLVILLFPPPLYSASLSLHTLLYDYLLVYYNFFFLIELVINRVSSDRIFFVDSIPTYLLIFVYDLILIPDNILYVVIEIAFSLSIQFRTQSRK